MEKQYALEVVQKGKIKLRKFNYYKRWKSKILGDREDGTGLLNLDGQVTRIDSWNDVFVWCTCLPSINPQRLALIAREGQYDCVIRVHDCMTFVTRVYSANSQKWGYGMFQKGDESKDDQEYRITATRVFIFPHNFQNGPEEELVVELGDCSDLITIENVPFPALEKSCR
jgi:hypothetical protein